MPRGVQGCGECLVLLLEALTHGLVGAEHLDLRQEGEGLVRRGSHCPGVSRLAHVREDTGCSYGIEGSSRGFSGWVVPPLTPGHLACHEHASTFQRTPGPARGGTTGDPGRLCPPAWEHGAGTPAPPQGHPHRLPFPSYTLSQGSVRIHCLSFFPFHSFLSPQLGTCTNMCTLGVTG